QQTVVVSADAESTRFHCECTSTICIARTGESGEYYVHIILDESAGAQFLELIAVNLSLFIVHARHIRVGNAEFRSADESVDLLIVFLLIYMIHNRLEAFFKRFMNVFVIHH